MTNKKELPRLNFMPGFFREEEHMKKKVVLQKSIRLDGRSIPYELERKSVKKINLRIRPDGTIYVSASSRHTMKQIEDLFLSNERIILESLEKAEKRKQMASGIERMSRAKEGEQCKRVVEAFCAKYYPPFAAACGGEMPEIRYRRMKSRWGSCAPSTKVLTFNTRLAYAPEECVEYVVVHEFCHFLYSNHSARFYAVVEAILPDWKNRRDELRKYEGLMV